MKYQRNPKIVFSILDEDYCLFNPENAQYFSINSTGSFIWDLLENPIEFDFMLEKVLSNFEVSEKICRNEIHSFLYEIYNKGMVIKLD